jgi:hypothetical protein
MRNRISGISLSRAVGLSPDHPPAEDRKRRSPQKTGLFCGIEGRERPRGQEGRSRKARGWRVRELVPTVTLVIVVNGPRYPVPAPAPKAQMRFTAQLGALTGQGRCARLTDAVAGVRLPKTGG